MELEETLNITKLIETAEELVSNGMLDMAAMGSAPVQEIGINGRVFKLKIVAELKPHPEAFCQECSKTNVNWYADNELWNAVMPDDGGILCPQCFESKAKGKGLSMIFQAIRLNGGMADNQTEVL